MCGPRDSHKFCQHFANVGVGHGATLVATRENGRLLSPQVKRVFLELSGTGHHSRRRLLRACRSLSRVRFPSPPLKRSRPWPARTRSGAVVVPGCDTPPYLPHAGSSETTTSRAVVIGDAAGTINSLSGEGIHDAMRSGLNLGRELASLREDTDPDAAIRRFVDIDRRAVRRHFRDCLLAHRLLRYRPLARRSIGAAADPSILEATARMRFDDRHLTGTTLRGILGRRWPDGSGP
jgi:hypothetical protein